jgi:glycosyltransferase involved in cell wall biosynthesis
MYNEQENARGTLEQLGAALSLLRVPFELIPVNDGSQDGTAQLLASLAHEDGRVRPVSYEYNRGRGRALREGFQAARGQIICSTDADLSYAPEYVAAMATLLLDHPDLDYVVGSPYIKGGGTEGVPFLRLWVSRIGNRILATAMGCGVHTVTGVLRAYRRELLLSLDLESDGKELHPEIIAKAHAAGFRGVEIPAVLKRRLRGASKFKLKATATSHLLFSLHERPMMLFGLVGLGVIGLGLCLGMYLAWQWWNGVLNPNRPLMTLFPLLFVGGLQIVLFGFLGSQLVRLRRELYRLRRSFGETQSREPDRA